MAESFPNRVGRTSRPRGDGDIPSLRHHDPNMRPGCSHATGPCFFCRPRDAKRQSGSILSEPFHCNARRAVSNDFSLPSTGPIEPDTLLHAVSQISPDERLRLIASLWESMPPNYWPHASADVELAIVQQGKQLDDAHPIAYLPWPVVEELLAHRINCVPPTKPSPKIYSAPRHFDLATIFAVTSAYSLLFGAMSGLRFPPIACVTVAGFISLVGVGQAMLYGGKQPRKASALAGAIIYAVVQSVMIYASSIPQSAPSTSILMLLVFAQGLIAGAICGYIAGVMVGGIFLVADNLRKYLYRSQPRQGVAEPTTSAGDPS
jgi:hypothetical protein